MVDERRSTDVSSFTGPPCNPDEFRAFVEAAPDAMVIADEHGAISLVNAQTEKLFGYQREELLGKPIEMLIPERYRGAHVQHRRAYGDSPRLRSMGAGRDPYGLRKDGSEFPVEINLSPFPSKKGVLVFCAIRDISPRREEELLKAKENLQAHAQERIADVWFLESLDRISGAIQSTNDLEHMMGDVLDEVLSIFACDRAWMVYPCDPESPTWRTVMERTRPEFPGASALGIDFPLDEQVAHVHRLVRASQGAVRFGAGSEHPTPGSIAERFVVHSQICMAVYPKVGKPYLFGLDHCRGARIWSEQEEKLLEAIGRRLVTPLTSVLISRDLQESKARLEEAQRVAHVGYWERDLATGRVTWSDETYRIFGLRPQEHAMDVAAVLELIHPDDRESVARSVDEPLHSGVRYGAEYRVVRPDGHVRIVRSQGDVKRDTLGRPCQMFGTVQDITDSKRTEEALRRSEAYLADAQRLNRTGSWAGDGTTRKWLYWSDEMFRLLGFDQQQGLPTRAEAFERIHPEDLDKVKQASDRHFLEKEDSDIEFRIVLPDGTLKHVHAVAHPVVDSNGELVEVVGTVVDISERRRAEEERERLRQLEADLKHLNRVSMMGELAATLAHEIKQPIAAAMTDADTTLRWLKREPPDVEKASESILRTVKDVSRAAEIIDHLRSFYKKRKGDPGEREWVDVNEVLREMVALLRSDASRYSISMRSELAEGLAIVMADRVQLQQVLLNLMLNGIEAMNDSGGELTVKSQCGPDGQLVISVSDTGVGLPAEHADQIFKAFFTTKPQGSGMGLAISRSIIEGHGGRLWATANSGRGATFHFSLPANFERHT
jgi:PAS domain S-box-containing protein